jgi:hypothetical protein
VAICTAVSLNFTVVCTAIAEPPDAGLYADISTDPIASLIHGWFSLLEQRPPHPFAIDPAASTPSLTFRLSDGGHPGPDEFEDWVADLRTQDPEVEYRLSAMRTKVMGDGLYRARFEFDRHSVDADGKRHVARRGHSWLIEQQAGLDPVVVRIEEQRLLFFSGTGPQIVCY